MGKRYLLEFIFPPYRMGFWFIEFGLEDPCPEDDWFCGMFDPIIGTAGKVGKVFVSPSRTNGTLFGRVVEL